MRLLITRLVLRTETPLCSLLMSNAPSAKAPIPSRKTLKNYIITHMVLLPFYFATWGCYPSSFLVFAEAITWNPQGEQATHFAHDLPRVVNPKILLTKLRPGQEIHLEMHAIKSNGRDHTKFSPVATASYRLMPHIQLLKPGDRCVFSSSCLESSNQATGTTRQTGAWTSWR